MRFLDLEKPMKTKLIMVLLLIGLGTSVRAQESVDQTIARLKTEITRRETIDRDETTPAPQKLTNRANLESARTALLNVVQAKITALEKYLNTLGDSIRPEEKDDVRTALRKLSTEANEAVNGGNGNSLAGGQSPEAAATSSP